MRQPASILCSSVMDLSPFWRTLSTADGRLPSAMSTQFTSEPDSPYLLGKVCELARGLGPYGKVAGQTMAAYVELERTL